MKFCKTTASTNVSYKLPVISISYLGKTVSQVAQISPIGTFARTPGGSTGLALFMGSDKAVIPFTVKRPDGMNDNDFAIFALNLASSIICRNGGDLELAGSGDIKLDASNILLNGDSDNVVKYSELNTLLQSLITQVNAAFATKLNGSGSAGSVAVDFTPAKSTTVRVGS